MNRYGIHDHVKTKVIFFSVKNIQNTIVALFGLVWLCGRLPEEGKWVSLEGFCLTSKGG